MSQTVAKLNVHVGANVADLEAGLARGEAHLKNFGTRFTSLSGMLTGALAGGSFLGGAGWALKLAADAERASTAFEVLLGSSEKAAKMLADIRQFANVSPFSNTQVREQAQLLLNYNVAADEVLSTIRMLSDVSGGSIEKFNRLALAYGQVMQKGVLRGQERNQLSESGLNPLLEISRRTGESMAELNDRMEAGAITANEVKQAFVDATSAGGRFNNMTERQAETLAGRFNTLKDNAEQLATSIGEKLAPAAGRFVEQGIAVVEWLKNLDTTTIANVTRLAALAASFTAGVLIVPRVISAVSAVITVFRQLATAQAIATALSGPQGWAILAGGLAAAGTAAYVLNQQFGGMNQKLATASGQAAKAADAVKAIGADNSIGKLGEETRKAFDLFKDADKQLESMRSKAESLTESLRTPGEKIKNDLQEAADLFQAKLINPETMQRAVDRAREELAKLEQDAETFERRGIGANDRNTAAAFSAVQEAQRNRDSVSDQNKRAEAQRDTTNSTLKDILAAIRAEEPPSFTVAEI